MGRTLVQKILYKRRKFITKKRIAAAVDAIAKLWPVVISDKPLETRFADIIKLVRADPAATEATDKTLRQRIKSLKAQIGATKDTAEADKLRQKLDVLHDLLLEDTTTEDAHE
jgi:predicted CoA-binding protein